LPTGVSTMRSMKKFGLRMFAANQARAIPRLNVPACAAGRLVSR
jgi:hypothetical protein